MKLFQCLLITMCLGMITPSCGKVIEQKQQDLLYQIITSGRWYVQNYTENNIDTTRIFSGYEFQFYDNNTVDAFANGTTKQASGTWVGNTTNRTIVANFPPLAGDTLKRLSYTWNITNSTTTFVAAETTTAAGKNSLGLQKK
jgi:hypothetical protein